MKSLKETDTLTVYWAPAVVFDGDFNKPPADAWFTEHGPFLYPDPRPLQSDLMLEKNPERGPLTYLSCPAATSVFKSTAVFYNSLECAYEYDLTSPDSLHFTASTPRFINYRVPRPPALLNKPTVQLQLQWIFFCEESLEMSITPPMFHKPMYLKYATTVPGTYDIGSWFRPVIFEIQLWESKGVLKFEQDEPLLYATFNTKRKVKLQRFSLNKVLQGYSIDSVSHTLGRGMSLEDRYNLFNNTSMREMIIKEIKSNTIETV
jgi:hypothetical protein